MLIVSFVVVVCLNVCVHIANSYFYLSYNIFFDTQTGKNSYVTKVKGLNVIKKSINAIDTFYQNDSMVEIK